MREIIISKQKDETKIFAIVENGILLEKYEQSINKKMTEGNIYIGKVQNVLQGMQSAFIDIGENKNTFIHIKDLLPKIDIKTNNKLNLDDINIKKYIKQGMPLLVQVKRDSTGKKGAKVSTHISLTGRFCVFMPDTEFITVSQKIEDKQEKERLIHILSQELPEGSGAIIRTSAKEKSSEEIQKDIQILINKWKVIKEKSTKVGNLPELLYENDKLIKKLIIDLIDQGLDRIITDDKDIYAEIKSILADITYNNELEVILKKDDILAMYQLNNQIEKTENRKIWLKCGGFITIDKTEALVAIDVNSCKYIGNVNLEKTAFLVNKEATIEIAKQLRLRNIGGIIVIDYIDMQEEKNKKEIIKILEESLRVDRSKTQVLEFTKLNLLELTRKQMYSN